MSAIIGFRRGSRSTADDGGDGVVLTGPLRGTKPWTSGLTLTSSGLRDLDVILGGAGQPIGTVILIEEDRWTKELATSLTKYWCAEALSHEQQVVIPLFDSHDGDEDDILSSSPSSLTNDEIPSSSFTHTQSRESIKFFLESLPRNLHWDKQMKKKISTSTSTNDGNANHQTSLHTSSSSRRPLEILEEDDEEDDDDTAAASLQQSAEDGLKIAWQYRKSIQDKRMGSIGRSNHNKGNHNETYCHSFDLSGRLNEQRKHIIDDNTHIVDLSWKSLKTRHSGNDGFQTYQVLTKHLNTIQKHHPNTVIRLFLRLVPVEVMSTALPLLMTHIRSNKLPIVVLVSVQPWTCDNTSSLISLHRSSDVVLQPEGFASRIQYPPPPEFRHLQGLLKIPKCSTANHGPAHFADVTISKRPASDIYGLKRDRRKLHISLLHIPPEDYAGGSGSVSGGGVRSGAGAVAKSKSTKPSTGMGCASGGGEGALDF